MRSVSALYLSMSAFVLLQRIDGLRLQMEYTDTSCHTAVPHSVKQHALYNLGCKCPPGMVVAGQNAACSAQPGTLRKFYAFRLKGKGFYCRIPSFYLQGNACVDTAPDCTIERSNCQLPHVQDACPSACNMDCANFPDLSADIRRLVRLGAEAQKKVAMALKNLDAGVLDAQLREWYCIRQGQPINSDVEKQVRFLLNGVHHVLMNVEFVYPETKNCDGLTLAWVEHKSKQRRNSRGQHVFHICSMQEDDDYQMRALIHEASHMKPMATEDVETEVYNEDFEEWVLGAAYGVDNCKHLCLKSGQAKALKNADTFSFFVMASSSEELLDEAAREG